MSAPILSTKLYVPPPRPELVPRPRLMERLNAGLPGKLTLISAPAGFGKTTVVSEWLAGGRYPAAWLSLDDADNEPTRFLAYLVAALQTVAPSIGQGVSAALQSPQPPPVETMLTSLLNDAAALPNQLILVLDDYHVVDTPAIDRALAFLLEHLPPRMHLAMTTREDPNLPLSRYRVQSHMTELRAADLRFTPTEAAAFFTQVMGLTLAAEDIAALEARTEGWIAGLQLAALSMRGRDDVSGFIRAFSGDNRYIVDYLVDEVLHRQPARVRSFLLQTSILQRLSGPLCDAVTGQPDSSSVLEALERGNLFVIPLDDKRRWFRYHHLFADVLQAHVLEEQPDNVPLLHRRASEWYGQNNFPAEAIHHALAAQDFERAAALVELAWPEMDSNFQAAAWLGWAQVLPDELIRNRPVLSAGYGWALLDTGNMEAAEPHLRNAEQWIALLAGRAEPPPEMVVVDKTQFAALPASVAIARTYHAQSFGDAAATAKHAQQALDLLPADDHLRHGQVASLLGLAYWANGELDAAYRGLAEGQEYLKLAGNLLFAASSAIGLGDIRLAQGRPRAAKRIYEQALALEPAQDDPVVRPVTADLHVGLALVYHQQGDSEAAARHSQTSKKLGEQIALADWQYRWCRAQAQINLDNGELDAALNMLDAAERAYYRNPLPEARPIAAIRARVWLAQGRLADAQSWAREQGLSADDEPSFLREFEHLTLARILLAQFQADGTDHPLREATRLLERLLQAAEQGGRTGSAIEILLLQALAHRAQGDIPQALSLLERALSLAEPEGNVRVFTTAGPPLAELLKKLKAEGGKPQGYIDTLLAAFEPQVAAQPVSRAPQPLVEPLSRRELEVLQLIAQGLSNREISEHLFLALDTVKGHNRRIFGKLNVQRRTEAVARARELGLV